MPIKKIFIFVVTLFFFQQSFSQVKISSPISILGYGQLLDNSQVFTQTIGNTKASFHHHARLNSANPASYAYLQTTSFSGGLNARRTRLSDNENASTIWSGNIGYLHLGLPLQNQFNAVLERKEPLIKWGMGIGLRPYSITGYDFMNEAVVSGDSLAQNFTGEGSTYLISWSNGWKYKQFAAGLEVGYLFGTNDFTRAVQFPIGDPGSSFIFNSIRNERVNYDAFTWNAGVMYDFVFGRIEQADGSFGAPNKYLTLGLTYHGNWSLKTETDAALFRENIRLFSVVSTDTISVINDFEGDGRLPGNLEFGASYVHLNKFRAGFNLSYGNWSKFRSGHLSETQSTDDALMISGGVAYTPEANSITNFFDRVTYSIGLNYGNDPRILNGEQIEKYGVDVGFSFPFVSARQISFVDLKVGYGKLGMQNGYKENYFSFGLGYSLTDNQWFIKRKYD